MGRSIRSLGLVDLHFHGAFGVDLMNATQNKLNLLSELLWRKGIAGFCPTTLSAPPKDLKKAVQSLGTWIRSGDAPGAKPLGIHLEGPFIHRGTCGAHPTHSIRAFNLKELEALWDASLKTLKIITLAPEILLAEETRKLCHWARQRQIILSAGHSHASQDQAEKAFTAGFSGVTHAWNALAFHHRSPGILGAALGRKGIHIELILDGVHISPPVIRWTLQIHPHGTCFISDCAPAAGTSGKKWHSFGNLKTQFSRGACRLPSGNLAGGGLLLSQAFCIWLKKESELRQKALPTLLKEVLPNVTSIPLKALGIEKSALAGLQVEWKSAPSGLLLRPIPQERC